MVTHPSKGGHIATASCLLTAHNFHVPGVLCRLLMAVKDADPKLLPLLSRAWELGPKHVGPNLLLSSADLRSGSRGAASHGGQRGSGLWDVPATQVVTLAKRGAIASPDGSPEDEAEKVSRAHMNCHPCPHIGLSGLSKPVPRKVPYSWVALCVPSPRCGKHVR